MRWKKVFVFLALAYGLAWSLGFSYFALGGRINSGAFLFVGVIYMFTPAAAAVITQKLLWKEPLRDLGLATPPQGRWMIIAWLLPLLLVFVALALSLALPGVTLSTTLEGFYAQITERLSSGDVEQLRRKLDHSVLAVPGFLLALSAAQVLIAGPTINALGTFGEELGWRGFLAHELEGLGFWPSALLIGIAWGGWHLPVIVNGYNYPGHPVAGPLLMMFLTVLISPLIGYVRSRANSVWGAAVFHGTFNAAATLVFFLRGANPMTAGMTGGTGLLTLLVANVCLWFHLRMRTSQ